MAMTDEERLIDLAASAWYGGPPTDVGRVYAQKMIELLRANGITLTPPPAPEPTYTRTFTETEWGFLIAAADHYRGTNPVTGGPTMPDGRLLVSHMEEQNPDPEPGA